MADITGHTPVPWSIGKRRWITSGDVDIARIHSVSKIGENEAVANAEFIVRACNSHDALLEALELYDSFSKANDDWRQMVRNLLNSDDTPEVVIKAREAIAKAKGGA